MSKRIWLWGIVILLLLASLPGIVNRWQVEDENTTYETVIPFHEIKELTLESGITVDEALSQLKEAGLTTISINPISLSSMDENETIDLYTPDDLKEALRFSSYELGNNGDIEGLYVSIPDEEFYEQLIRDNFKTEDVEIGNETLLHIRLDDQVSVDTVLGYDRELIDKIISEGFQYITRVENTDDQGNQNTVDALTQLKGESLQGVLFSGTEVIGYPELDVVTELTTQLHEAGFYFYSIEFTRQSGNVMVARQTNYDFVRLHSMDIEMMKLQDNVDRAIRAVKERNMRSLFLHIPDAEPHESLEATVTFLNQLSQEMPEHFELGQPTTFDEIEIPTWSLLAAFAAGIIFIYLVSEIVPVLWLRLGATGLMAVLALAYFLLDRLLFAQAFALAVAVAAPIYAVIKTSQNGTNSVVQVLISYAIAALYTLIGIVIVVAVLNGNGFITGFELFRGVKLVYVIPIAFVAGYFFWQIVVQALNTPVKYWHLIVMGALGLMGIYYIMRTGNTATVSSIEMAVRHGLEEILYVRPRTKEIVLGFPAFVLGLYVMGINKIWGKLLMIPGVIGFLSIMNTFTHFHIPLEISLLRVVYGLGFGLMIGLIAVAAFKFLHKNYEKLLPKRSER